MNKKIYYNDKFIEFAGVTPNVSKNPLIEYIPSVEFRAKRVDRVLNDFLEEASDRSYVIGGGDFERMIPKLKPHFHYIEAAGGFIQKRGQFLFIHRHGRWDLPKGKLEKGESIPNCAVRECEEECGVKDLKIIHTLNTTWHIYPYKGSYALKQTFWFYMETDFGGELHPQLEESIDAVRWFSAAEVNSVVIKDTYHTITDVVVEGLKCS